MKRQTERHPKSYWVKVIKELRRSGLTQRDFAEKNKLSYFSVQHWSSQLPAKVPARRAKTSTSKVVKKAPPVPPARSRKESVK